MYLRLLVACNIWKFIGDIGISSCLGRKRRIALKWYRSFYKHCSYSLCIQLFERYFCFMDFVSVECWLLVSDSRCLFLAGYLFRQTVEIKTHVPIEWKLCKFVTLLHKCLPFHPCRPARMFLMVLCYYCLEVFDLLFVFLLHTYGSLRAIKNRNYANW